MEIQSSETLPIAARELRRDLLTALHYAYNEDDWVNPLSEALGGVTVEGALWTPDSAVSGQRSIWHIVLHMAVWTENIAAVSRY